MEYITNYSFGKPRTYPANLKTIGRQKRALQLVEKLIGHSLDEVTDSDQLLYMEKILPYAQGTRTVTTHTFQRFVWWGIKQGHLSCQNLIKGNEAAIIGPKTPVRYAEMSQPDVEKFLRKIKDEKRRIILYLVYLGGLDSSEIIDMRVSDVTESTTVVRRMKLKTVQILPLPKWFQKELYEYALRQGDPNQKLFEFALEPSIEQRDTELDVIWKKSIIEARMFMHTTFRDFRINAIRHYYFHNHDIEAVKAFAGAPSHKRGWIEQLLTDQDVYLKTMGNERKIKHG